MTIDRPAHRDDRPEYVVVTVSADLRHAATEYEREEDDHRLATFEEREVFRHTAAKLRLVALLVESRTWSTDVGIAFLEAARGNLLAVHVGEVVTARAAEEEKQMVRDSAHLPTLGVKL